MTGVQTCALPILEAGDVRETPVVVGLPRDRVLEDLLELRDGNVLGNAHEVRERKDPEDLEFAQQIGRASCRERV